MAGALDGIVVLDLSQGAAGPICAMHLGDLGADIIKVEPPAGDWGRRLGPPFVEGAAASFLGMNRNKRSITVDLKTDGGPAVVLDLAAGSDVMIESFRPGVAERLGIGFEQAIARNPKLVYASISAFGRNGPWRDRPGVDGVAQAMGGIMSVTGEQDGGPVKVGVPAADMAGGMFTTQAILAALFARERSGSGQHVDVSLIEALLAYQVVPMSMYLASGEPPKRLGSAAPYAAPNEAFPTADGWIMVAAYTPKRWHAFCAAVGAPELETDPRFDTNDKRVPARAELRAVLEPILTTRTTGDWLTVFESADILCGPILTYPEIVEAPHVVSSGAIVGATHADAGEVRAPGYPGRMGGTPEGRGGELPLIAGEHTIEILRGAGFEEDQIERLLETGVVVDGRERTKVEGRAT